MKKILFSILFPVITFAQSNMLFMFSGDYLPETDAYISRVESDGGIVVDKKALNDTIKAIKSRGTEWDDLVFYVAPNFGVKKDANNKVTKWYDIKNSLDAYQADTSKSPTWSSTKVTLDGTNDFMTIDYSAPLAITDKITIWAYLGAWKTSGTGMFLQRGITNSYYIWLPTAANVDFATKGTSTADLNAAHGSDTAFKLWRFQYDKDGGTNNKKIYEGATLKGQATVTNAISTDTSNLIIGFYSTSFFKGDIGHFRIYKAVY